MPPGAQEEDAPDEEPEREAAERSRLQPQPQDRVVGLVSPVREAPERRRLLAEDVLLAETHTGKRELVHRVLDVPVLDLAPGAGELIPRADLRWVDDAAERADRLTERTAVLAEHDDVGAEQERADRREHETPARRTRETWERLVPELAAEVAVAYEERLYNAGADANLFELVIKVEGHKLADSAGHVHFTHVAQALAISGLGDLVTPSFEIGLGGLVVENFAFFVDDFSSSDAPNFVF